MTVKFVIALVSAFCVAIPIGASGLVPDPIRFGSDVPKVGAANALGSIDPALANELESYLRHKLNIERLPNELPRLQLLSEREQLIVDDALPHHTKTIPAATVEDFTGTVHITEDWEIHGTANFNDATIIFDGLFNLFVRNTGKLTITGSSSVADGDEDRFTFGAIRATGELTIEGTAANPISVESTFIALTPRGNNDFAPTVIRHVQFSDALTGIATSNTDAIIEFNTFTKLDSGVVFLRSALEGAARGTINDNTFVGNRVGVFFDTTTQTMGTVKRSEFRANVFGVLCQGRGAAVDETPDILENNFRNHYAEAYSGIQGVNVGDVAVVASSRCTVDGNFFEDGETTYKGGDDVIINNQANPVANNAVAGPITPTVITNTQSMNNPVLNAPLIVDDDGQLTVTGTLNANGWSWGSGTGGQIIANGVTIVNNGWLVLRTDDDQADDIKIEGPSQRAGLFAAFGLRTLHALQYRNSVVLDGWQANNFDVLLTQSGGLFVDENVRSPDFTHGVATNGGVALLGFIVSETVSDSWFENILFDASRHTLGGSTSFHDNLVKHVGGFGVVNIGQTLTTDDNTFEDVTVGVAAAGSAVTITDSSFTNVDEGALNVQFVGTAGSITSTNNDYDGGLVGILSVLGSVTSTDDLYTQQNFGVLSAADTSFALTRPGVHYNAFGIAAYGDAVTVTSGNFRDNYHYALFPMPLVLLEQDVIQVTSITCTTCWFYRDDDKAWDDAGGDATVTVTESLAENDAPDPAWLDDVIIADAGETKAVAGTLTAPAIAREGGRLQVEGQLVEGGGRFVLGGKTGGNDDGDPGEVTLQHSEFDDVRFIAVPGVDSTVSNNLFRNSLELIEITDRGQTLECNAFDDVALPVNWMRQGDLLPDFVFRRNIITGPSGGTDAGFADTDSQVSIIEDNGYFSTDPRTTTTDGLLDRFTAGAVEFHGNFIGAQVGFRELNFGGLNANFPDAADVENTWWNSAGGPSYYRIDLDPTPDALVQTRAGGAAILQYQGDEVFAAIPDADFEPFTAVAPTIPLCLGFRFSPTSPNEAESVAFSDLSFAADGAGITERTWSWGDGSPDEAVADPLTTHDFRDGGTTVTLAVETEDGRTGTVGRSLSVAHVPPVADFTSAIADELNPVGFADTSTHPNTPFDDPPTGWTYDWSFNGEGTDTARNPSFDFADGGSKSITLTATDNDGKTDTETKTIVVPHVAPVAAFAFSPAAPLETATVTLLDQSTHPNTPTDSVTSRSWSCSDGFTSSATSPPHKFADGGTYSCTLTVKDNDDMEDSVTKSVTVGHVAPTADFVIAPAAPTELTTISFTDQSTHVNSPTDAPPTGWTYDWDFDGEGASSARNPTFNFADGGTKTVTLTVTDNDGLSHSVSKTITVGHVAPAADFTFSPPAPDPGDTVSFTSTSTHPNAPTDSITTFAWEFDDGSPAGSGSIVDHVFAADGSFAVSLTVTDDDGLTSAVTKIVAVGNKLPVPVFTFSPETPTDLETVDFDASDSFDPDGTVDDFAWDFGDGDTASGSTAGHQFADDGLFPVTLTVTDNKGATASLTRVVEVLNVPPTADFDWSPKLLLPGDTTQFSELSSDPDGNVVSFLWDFDDGATSAAPSPSHAYAESGIYAVSLTVTDDDGDASTATKNVCVTGVSQSSGPGGLHAEVCTTITLQDLLELLLGLVPP